MTKLQRKITAVLSSGVLVVNLLSPMAALADTNITISGNGTNTDNTADVTMTTTTNVTQNNTANVTNNVNAGADSGGNEAKDNTGGDVTIDTGDAKTDVKVDNMLNSNSASVDCCPGGDTKVLISGNGSDSKNDVKLDQKSTTDIWQDNKANVKNYVYADADTGGNKAKDNTGGDVTIKTGDAGTSVAISTAANANMAMVGGNGGSGGSLNLLIVGNGHKSDNDIDLKLDKSIMIDQDNNAKVVNYVNADANSGDNEAKDNTGGAVSIDTGDADTDVDVNNEVNFNYASVDCGCLLDVTAKIADNGSDSDNDIKAKLTDARNIWQDNVCGKEHKHGWWWERHGKKDGCTNDIDADADTGDNKAKDNTGDPGDDPSITTGDASTTVDVNNSGNVNSYGGSLPADWPHFDVELPPSWWFFLGWLGFSA